MKKVLCIALLSAAYAAEAKVVVRPVGDGADVEFQYADAQADRVSVAGSFNQWSVTIAPMQKGQGGVWTYVLHGVKSTDVLQYKFVVGSAQQWTEDPDAPDTTPDFKGGRNGQIAVARFLPHTARDDVASQLTQAGGAKPTGGVSVSVTEGRNLLPDPGFEAGNLQGWTVQGDSGAVWVERDKSNAHSGEHSLKYTQSHPFNVLVFRRLTNLKPGSYTLRAWAAGGGGENVFKLFAYDCSQTAKGKSLTVPIANAGWQKWKQYSVNNIDVTGTECTVGVYIDGNAGNWGNVDDIEFRRDAAWAKLSPDSAQ